MKKFFVVGNPIEHSLSPKLHNYWIKKNNIKAIYEKKKINENEINLLISEIRSGKLSGINITVPFKKSVIELLDELSVESQETQSVNTVYLDKGRIIGCNTDIFGFEQSLIHTKYNPQKKTALILGAGGVVPSIIYVLKKMNIEKLFITNRTKEKANDLKKIFNDIEILEWGDLPQADIIINATSLGLKPEDNINIEYNKIGRKIFFYDVIYNPSETNFLKKGKILGNKTENGKMMFIYQAQKSFSIWHKKNPIIDNEVIKLLS